MDKRITPADELSGAIAPPPDKSISHRAAMFAALHEGRSEISNFSEAADPLQTLKCLTRLGVEIKQSGSELVVEGVGRDGLKEPESELDCGNSGTTMRLLSGIIAGAGIRARLTGDESLSNRTMKRIIVPLEQMGASISAREDHYAPLEFTPTDGINPITFRLPIPSAQLKSCVLLAGLFGSDPTVVIEKVQSRDHTERLLNLAVEDRNGLRIITSSLQDRIPGQSCRIPGDFSAAAFWLVAASIHPKAEIILHKTGINPTRRAAMEILQQMGAEIAMADQRMEGAEPVADLTAISSDLQPVEITAEQVPNCIDEIPILAVAMLFADGKSRITGAEELRHKETDRLKATAELIELAGGTVKEREDGLEITGDPIFKPRPATYRSFGDHRIAMAAAVLSLMSGSESKILNADCTDISYPSFWDDLDALTN